MDNIEKNDLQRIKNRFEQVFPSYASRLNAVANKMNGVSLEDISFLEQEIEAIQKELIDKITHDVKKSLTNDNNMDFNSVEEGLAIQLRYEKYKELCQANEGDIETEIILLLDALQRLQSMSKSDSEAVLATLLIGGGTAVTAAGITYLTHLLTSGTALLPAAFATVQYTTPTLIAGVISIVLVSIIIPLVYFITKPAACILILINELHQDLVFDGDYFIHGKCVEKTNIIPKVAKSSDGELLYSAGIFASQKLSGALIGTQYGFNLKQADIGKINFSFGLGCPLSSGKNNCMVGYNQSAKSIAEDANKNQKRKDSLPQDEYQLDIQCHSSSGSVAYYIARVSYK